MTARTKSAAVGIVLVALLGIYLAMVDNRPSTPSGPPAAASTAATSAPDPLPEASPTELARTEPQTEAGATTPGKVLFSAKWGSGMGELGHIRPQEANPEGPKSFALTDDGYVVLDQLNGRLVRYDTHGKAKSTVNVSPTTDDVAVTKDGKMALLDRLVDKSVSLIDKDGRKLGQLSLEAAGIKTTGTTTGVYIDGKNVYAERDHGGLVLLGTVDGQPPAAKAELSGRPSKDGSLLLSSGVVSTKQGTVYLNVFDRAKNTLRFTIKLAFGSVIHQLMFLDSDTRGVIYVGAWILKPGDKNSDTVHVLCVAATDGHRLGETFLPVNQQPEESFRDFAVEPDGTIVYALRTTEGVDYLRATCP